MHILDFLLKGFVVVTKCLENSDIHSKAMIYPKQSNIYFNFSDIFVTLPLTAPPLPPPLEPVSE